MSEKTTITQMSLPELQREQAKYQQAKEKHPEKWTEKFQSELDAINSQLEKLETMEAQLKKSEIVEPKQDYTPAKGTEHLVHARIIKGRRFDSNTGKEISTPYVQLFSKSEFRVFKAAATRLGYTIDKVLYEPA